MATIANVRGRPTERRDLWWLEPTLVVVGFTAFVIYTVWSATRTTGYYYEPYLSPFFSPCITANCEVLTFGVALVGPWFTFAPAILIVGFPLVFRATCYFFRRTYYRSYFLAPPSCAVPDAAKHYSGESRFPFILQNIHRYTWYVAALIFFILAYDAVISYHFPGGWGIGLGSLLMTAEAGLIGLYTFSCHSCRALCGGWLDAFHGKPFWYRLWMTVSRLNVRHGTYFWVSLAFVVITDVYIRLLAAGVLTDPRIGG